MKNNIIIAGVPRAGKSTISHRLATHYGYQHGFNYSRICEMFPRNRSEYIFWVILYGYITPDKR